MFKQLLLILHEIIQIFCYNIGSKITRLKNKSFPSKGSQAAVSKLQRRICVPEHVQVLTVARDFRVELWIHSVPLFQSN